MKSFKYHNEISNFKIIENKIYEDERGFLYELYKNSTFKSILGKDINFIQDNFVYSHKNVLRGLHFQKNKPQGKFICVLKGEIFDVALDLRKGSKTFGKYFSIFLSEKNSISVYIPPGFAHGFCGLQKENYMIYSCTNYRHQKSEIGIKFNDKDLNIKWPIKNPILSKI